MEQKQRLGYNIELALVRLVGRLARKGETIPVDIAAKTEAYYRRVIERNTRDLYNGDMSEREFVDALLELIDAQLTRAWNEGMRQNGLDPKDDMIPEWEDALEEKKLSEIDYVDDFAAAIVQAAEDDKKGETPGEALPGLLSRSDVWANRYNDIVNFAVVTTAAGKDRLIWRYGDTDHCNTCAELHGIVAFASEWELAGVQPQSPDNPVLDCHGWNCACQLIPTEQRRTRNAFDRIMGALGK